MSKGETPKTDALAEKWVNRSKSINNDMTWSALTTNMKFLVGDFSDLCRQLERDAALEAKLAEVGGDAARYQWLREHTDSMSVKLALTVAEVKGWGLDAWSGDDLDEAIDKAMKEKS